MRDVDLSLKWMITQKWYVGGGYSYIWEDREQATSDAANNRFFINFGYQGLSQRSLRRSTVKEDARS